MNFDKLVESMIKEAQERGEFDNLPGRGKSIDLAAYFDTPEETRVAQSVLKNANIASHELELLKEIAELKQVVTVVANEGKKKKIQKEIEKKQLEFSLMMERNRSHRRKK